MSESFYRAISSGFPDTKPELAATKQRKEKSLLNIWIIRGSTAIFLSSRCAILSSYNNLKYMLWNNRGINVFLLYVPFKRYFMGLRRIDTSSRRIDISLETIAPDNSNFRKIDSCPTRRDSSRCNSGELKFRDSVDTRVTPPMIYIYQN